MLAKIKANSTNISLAFGEHQVHSAHNGLPLSKHTPSSMLQNDKWCTNRDRHERRHKRQCRFPAAFHKAANKNTRNDYQITRPPERPPLLESICHTKNLCTYSDCVFTSSILFGIFLTRRGGLIGSQTRCAGGVLSANSRVGACGHNWRIELIAGPKTGFRNSGPRLGRYGYCGWVREGAARDSDRCVGTIVDGRQVEKLISSGPRGRT
jgi:hypothetical protein